MTDTTFSPEDARLWSQNRPDFVRRRVQSNQQPWEVEKAIVEMLTASNILVSTDYRNAVFMSGGHLSRVSCEEVDGHRMFSVKSFKQSGLTGRLASLADWIYVGRNGDSDSAPPSVVVQNVLERADELFENLPVLEQVITYPLYSADGVLQSTPGYSRDTRCWYAPPPHVEIGEIPAKPSDEDVRWALDMLLENLVVDFPFADDGNASRANALALGLQPFVRPMIKGPTPLHTIDAPTEGTGKTLLVELLFIPSFGPGVQSSTIATDEEEWKKQLVSTFLAGTPYVFLDNVPTGRPLASGHLASTLTKAVYDERILGGNQKCTKVIRHVFAATGNNMAFSGELARRCVPTYLNAHSETPHIGREFKHADVERWAERHRGELTRACLILIQRWIAAGKPRCKDKVLGKFEEWSGIMGGILREAGVKGFLTNLSTFYDEATARDSDVQPFITQWYQTHGTRKVTVHDLIEAAHEHLGLTKSVGPLPASRPTPRQLGAYMRGIAKRVYGDLEVQREVVKGRPDRYRLWNVKRPADASAAATSTSSSATSPAGECARSNMG